MKASKLPLVVLATAGVALAGTVVAANFSHREMGVLLGPAIEDGNRFEVLLNGARKSVTFESYGRGPSALAPYSTQA